MTTATLPETRTSAARRVQRTAGLCLSISDHTGHKSYTLIPQRSPSDCLRSWRLRKRYNEPGDLPDEYTVRLYADGRTVCTCPGHERHHHCKHVDALEALGVIDPSQLTALATARVELQAERQEYERLSRLYQQEREALAQSAGLLPSRSTPPAELECPAEVPDAPESGQVPFHSGEPAYWIRRGKPKECATVLWHRGARVKIRTNMGDKTVNESSLERCPQ